MKPYLLLTCLVVLLAYKASAQTKTQDTVPAKNRLPSPPKVSYLAVSAPPLILLKDINANIGKRVMIKDIVFAHHVADTVEVIALGGKYPHDLLTVVLYGKAFQTLKNTDVDGKTIVITGTPEFYKGDNQMYIGDPNYIHVYTQ